MGKIGFGLCAALIAALVTGCSDKDDSNIFAGNKGFVINELKVNIPEDEHSKQFIELKGKSGETLKNVYMVAIDGDEDGDEEKPFEDWGYVDYARSLNGVKVGENGLILIKNPMNTTPWPILIQRLWMMKISEHMTRMKTAKHSKTEFSNMMP